MNPEIKQQEEGVDFSQFYQKNTPPPPAITALAPLPRKNVKPFMVIISVVVLVVTLCIVWFWFQPPHAQRVPANQPIPGANVQLKHR